MGKATIEKELLVETPNEIGTAGKLTKVFSDQAHVNIKALWGGIVNGKGVFSVVTENNNKAVDALKGSDFNNFKEQDVVVVRTTDTIGTCSEIANKVGGAGIDINYLFTTIFDSKPAVVLSTNNNQAALKLFD